MSESEAETDKLVYPSAKVGSITRAKNKITKTLEENPAHDLEDLIKYKDSLQKRIKTFEEACDTEKNKNTSEEEAAEFKKWHKKQKNGNDLFLNKLEKLIIDRNCENDEKEDEDISDEEESNYFSDKETDEEPEEELNKQETKLVQCLRTLQMSAHLPQRLPQKFDGTDVTEYLSWSLTFHQTIERKCHDFGDRYFYLLEYTSGEANTLVSSCHQMNLKQAYKDAKKLLEEKYGNEFIIAQHYLQKLNDWPQIKAEDGAELSKFSTFLTSVLNLMGKLSSLNQLNSPRDIKEVLMKLPYGMRVHFRSKMAEQINKKNEVRFKMLVDFVNQQSSQLNVPLFGDISDRKSSHKSNERAPNKSSNDTTKRKTFYTKDKEERKFCPCCKKNNHYLDDCFFFTKKARDEKDEFIKKNKLCYSCLKSSSHYAKDCDNKSTCRTCGKHHPSCLHLQDDNPNSNRTDTKINNRASDDDTKNINLVVKGSSKIACPSIPVIIRSIVTNKCIQTYVALDNCSSASYMDQNLMNILNISGEDKTLEVTTINDNKMKIKTAVVENLEILSLDKSICLPLKTVYAKKNWPFDINDSPSFDDVKNIESFQSIPLQFINSKIGLLVGMNEPDIMKPLQIIQTKTNGPYASRHKLGWAINGPLKTSPTSNHCFRTTIEDMEDIETKFEKVFSSDFNESNIENVKSSEKYSPNEIKWIEFISKNCKKSKDSKKYEISLPLKNKGDLPNNYNQAYSRLLSTKKKLQADENLCKEYSEFMKTMRDKQFVEEVPEDEISPQHNNHWFLTHHAVRHKKKGKLRIVFDCSLEYQNASLNNSLWKGPDLANTLVGVLLRFRENIFAVTGDIEKMYYQVEVPKQDRTYLRFLWFPDDNLSCTPRQYWLKVHLFGATSSSSVANYALKKCVENAEHHVKDTVENSFYVDDLLASFDHEEEAIKTIKQICSSLEDYSFNLTAFASNSKEIMKSIPQNKRAKEKQKVRFDNDDSTESILGMTWNTTEDTIGFDINIPIQPNTRRGVLSTIFSIYDPLFLATPALIKAKRIFQATCAEKLGWDDTLPEHLLNPWLQWKQGIKNIEELQIPRCYKTGVNSDSVVSNTQLHIFCDGSEVAYGAVAYLRFEYSSGNIDTSIVTSKSRLTPLNRASLKTIPRIELNSAKLAVAVFEKVSEEIRLEIQNVFFWTDSMSNLMYIFNEDKQLQRFVANRVAYIRSKTEISSWRFVPGKLNPADMLSRGVTNMQQFIRDETWTKGPLFLKQDPNEWPTASINSHLPVEDPEVKKKHIALTTKTKDDDPIEILFNSTSNFHKLLCRIAAFLRLKEYLQTRIMKRGKLSVDEITRAEREFCKYHQTCHFQSTLELLKKKKVLNRNDALRKLNPFLDEFGLLRIGGRLSKSNLLYTAKHPIVLKAISYPVKLLIETIHRKCGHLGKEAMLAEIKQKYHILKVKKVTRSIINECVACRRVQSKPCGQLMADLPPDRIIGDAPPFTNTGTDLFGPFYVSKGRGKQQEKRYGVLFVCLVCRATHIEITPSLDTDSYINALRRFIARRGTPKIIRSDNGTNLVAAEKELKSAIVDWNQKQIDATCLQNKIQWIFQPPQASHFGGCFERQIRTLRKIFNSIMQDLYNRTKLTDDMLSTIFAEIENIMNNKPITIVSLDVNDMLPLTPNTLLKMQSSTDFPPGLFSPTENYTQRRWKQVQQIADMFWRRFKKEYLPLLNVRQKWNDRQRSLIPGDIVIVSDQSEPRNNWCLGKISSVKKSSDNLVRSAEVIINKNNKGNQKIIRPIHKLVLLSEGDK